MGYASPRLSCCSRARPLRAPCHIHIESRSVALPCHELRSEDPLGLVLVVRPTPEPHPGHGRSTSASHGLDVVVFEKSSRGASVIRRAHERALPQIALPDGTPNVRRDVPRPRGFRSIRRRLRRCLKSGSPELDLRRLSARRGRDTRAALRRSSCEISASSARSSTCATSPDGTEWLSNACARRSLSCVFLEIGTRTR